MGSETRFDGSIPELYDRHLGPVLFEPHARDLASRLRLAPRSRVLEVACGTGIVTRRLLSALPSDGRLLATDLNEAMLDHARGRVTSDPRLEWSVADALRLDHADGSFDAWVCQFGVMFFPDKVAGLREARRVLRPGGTLVFNVFRAHEHNAFGRIADETVRGFFASDPPGFYRVPFGWGEETVIAGTLTDAGFTSFTIERLELETSSASAADLAVGLVRGNPIVHELRARSGADVGMVEAAVAAALGREGGAAPWRGVLRSLVVTARR